VVTHRASGVQRQEELQGGGRSGSLKVSSILLHFNFLCLFFSKEDECHPLLLFYYSCPERRQRVGLVVVLFLWSLIAKKTTMARVVVIFLFCSSITMKTMMTSSSSSSSYCCIVDVKRMMNLACHPLLLFCKHLKTMTNSYNACCSCGVVSQGKKTSQPGMAR